ncbi:hypothetical protein [Streptomyces parvus]|uniref:Uncharacterized protein n=1 Tax=Streptomyces parvus TaxID=66428 RepID=A0A7K3RRV1_9ACTN|nr:hypothetical protein [Streptomyces parvus]NEC17935.1 hypothetical protein [Streptomyces parvus]
MTTQPERLHHLLDRARRGVILPAEGEALAVLVGELEADLHRYEEVVVGDLNEANTGLQRQATRTEARVRKLEAELYDHRLGAPMSERSAAELRRRLETGQVARRAVKAPGATCACGRPDPGPCQPCPDNTPSLHCACDCTPARAEHGEGAAGM